MCGRVFKRKHLKARPLEGRNHLPPGGPLWSPKDTGNIPDALYEAITFLAQALPKRSVPTWLELLFAASPTCSLGYSGLFFQRK